MAANISVLIFSGLALTLLGAMALPAPAFKVRGEIAILVAVLGFNLVGDGLKELLDIES